MKTMTKVSAVATVAVLALALAAPAKAACGTNAIISSIGSDGTSYIFGPQFQAHPTYTVVGYYGPVAPQVYSFDAANPAPTPLGPNARVTFWGLGTGDPAPGFGNDNGSYDMIAGGGLYVYGYGVGGGYYPDASFWYGATINSTWEGAGTDNCVGGNACMCVLITDEEGGVGTFAITGGMSTANVDTFFNRSGTSDGGRSNAPIILVPIPGPSIVGSNRDAVTNDVTLTMNVPPVGTVGDYTQDGCACAPVAYKILQTIVPRGGMPPVGRDLGAWTELAQADDSPQPTNGTAINTQIDLKSSCGSQDNDVYLATQLIFDSGFGTHTVSSNSTRMECGPSLATPGDSNSRPDRPTRPDRPRGGKKR